MGPARTQGGQTSAVGAPPIDSYEYYDRPIAFRDDSPVAICRVRAKSDLLRANAIGDRISLNPKQARWLERQGVVIVEVAEVKPSDIRAVGSVDLWIDANPKAYLLSKAQKNKLGPIPGIPTEEEKARPWDFE